MVVNMPIIRAIHDKDHPYTVISNALVNDQSLSLNALAVMTYLISKPHDWRVRADDIQRRFQISRGKVYGILDELMERGYLSREIIRQGGRVKECRYTVMEHPVPALPDTDSPLPDLPLPDSPLLENQLVVNRDNDKVITLPSNELKKERERRKEFSLKEKDQDQVQVPEHLVEYVKAYTSPLTNNLPAYQVTPQDLLIFQHLHERGITPNQLAGFIRRTLQSDWWANPSVGLRYISQNITGDRRSYAH